MVCAWSTTPAWVVREGLSEDFKLKSEKRREGKTGKEMREEHSKQREEEGQNPCQLLLDHFPKMTFYVTSANHLYSSLCHQ